MALQKEKWKTVKLDFKFTNKMRVEVSNLGQVRTYTKIADGKILNGAVINGYRVVNFKLFKPRESKIEKHLAYFKRQISKLVNKIALDRLKLKSTKKKNKEYFVYKKQVEEADELLKLLKKNYRKKFNADEKNRTINCNLLVHRLVATYFCRKPSANHSLVIHLDYDKQQNNFQNLKWVTQEQTTAHWQANPTVKKQKPPFSGRAETSTGHKLTRTKVAILKKRIKQGKDERLLAKQFEISEMQLWRIKNGINWGDVRTAI